jgi:hypothetical protein
MALIKKIMKEVAITVIKIDAKYLGKGKIKGYSQID